MAVKISDIKAKLETLIREDETDPAFISKIGDITKDLDDFETEYIDFLGKHQDLRNKYIEVCKSATFPVNQADEEIGSQSEPPSLEKLVETTISNRKEN